MDKDEYKLTEEEEKLLLEHQTNLVINAEEKQVLVSVSDVLKSADGDLLLDKLLFKVDKYGGIMDMPPNDKFVIIINLDKEKEIREFIWAYNKLFDKNIKILGDENERKTKTNVNQPSND